MPSVAEDAYKWGLVTPDSLPEIVHRVKDRGNVRSELLLYPRCDCIYPELHPGFLLRAVDKNTHIEVAPNHLLFSRDTAEEDQARDAFARSARNLGKNPVEQLPFELEYRQKPFANKDAFPVQDEDVVTSAPRPIDEPEVLESRQRQQGRAVGQSRLPGYLAAREPARRVLQNAKDRAVGARAEHAIKDPVEDHGDTAM